MIQKIGKFRFTVEALDKSRNYSQYGYTGSCLLTPFLFFLTVSIIFENTIFLQ